MCNHPAAKGHCVNVPTGMPPTTAPSPAQVKTCPSDSLKPCEGDGLCDGNGNCRAAAPKGKFCKATCVTDAAGDYVLYSHCDGSKGCAPATAKLTPCGAYRCQPNLASCFGRCTDAAKHCATGCACNPFTAECEGC